MKSVGCQNLGGNLAHLGLKHQEAPQRLIRGFVGEWGRRESSVKSLSWALLDFSEPCKTVPCLRSRLGWCDQCKTRGLKKIVIIMLHLQSPALRLCVVVADKEM